MKPSSGGISADWLTWGKRLASPLAVAVLALIAPHGFTQTTANDQWLVESIDFAGLNSVKPHQLPIRWHTIVGRPYDPEGLREDLEQLRNLGLFRPDSVGAFCEEFPKTHRLRVYFGVKEYPKSVRQIVYNHAHHLSIAEWMPLQV
jgi:hypothetical protein